MGFKVVHGPSVQKIWAPIVDSDTLYIGQIVECQGAEGCTPIGVSAGANDTTGKVVPFGIVVGINSIPGYGNFDSTYKTDKITDATPHASTTEFQSVEGVWPKGDKQAMVEIALIDATTIIEGPIFNAAVGTAPTVGTVTTGSADGLSCTTNAVDVAGVAVLSTVYFRAGANKGQYRISDDTSATAHAWDKATVYDVEVGDTLVKTNLRAIGPSRVQFDSESIYIDCAAALTTDYYGIDVIKLDLSVAGKEHCHFRFNADHFTLKRA